MDINEARQLLSESMQYIGARYVPKFYKNSVDHDSIEWESDVAYEPLTVVSYLYDSYTSKIPVPSTVGNPADNSHYWARTGQFNAAIAALQEEMGAVKLRVTDIETQNGNATLETTAQTLSGAINELKDNIEKIPTNRKFILIGDSYGYGVRGGGQSRVTGWIQYFANKFPNQTYYYNQDVPVENVFSFTAPIAGNGFEGLLRFIAAHYLDDVNFEEITDIVVIGGNNDDRSATGSAIRGAIDSFCNYARSTFPNAEIRIGAMAISAKGLMIDSEAYSAYKAGAARNGCDFMYELAMVGCQSSWNSGYGHFSQTGYDSVNPLVMERIFGGELAYKFAESIPLTMNSEVAESIGTIGNFNLVIARTQNRIEIELMTFDRYTAMPIHNLGTWSGSGSYELVPFTSSTELLLPIGNNETINPLKVLAKTANGFVEAAVGKMQMKVETNRTISVKFLKGVDFPNSPLTSQNMWFMWDGIMHSFTPVI